MRDYQQNLWVQDEISLNVLLVIIESELRVIKDSHKYDDEEDNLEDK